MAAETFDLVVIGGGINGTGIARDAALRGLSVCLLEQHDLCQATTRWSSRLIHGGLRYLEFGELGLVHESLRERELLLRHAPHLVRPLPLTIPVYGDSRRRLGTIGFGLWIYDLLSAGRSLPGHQRLGPAETLVAIPGLARTGLVGSARYYDAQVTFPERLVVENALAAHAAGAVIHTRHRVEQLLVTAGRITGVVARHGDEPIPFAARIVVNAAGPWADRVLAAAGQHHPRLLGPTKGTHIVLPRSPGLGAGALYAEARADGRPFFIIPWNGQLLVGTTDLRWPDDPGTAAPVEDEIDYLLAEVRRLLPDAGLDRSQVAYAYTGVRPLARQGPRETAAITRRHLVRQHQGIRGLYTVVGGKLTTYRQLAEDVVDQVVARLGRAAAPCTTASQPLPGGNADEQEVLAGLAGFPDLPPGTHARLWELYGARAGAVAGLTRTDPALGQPLAAGSAAIGAEVVLALREEFAVNLPDLLFRRTMLGLSPDLGRGAVAGVLAVARRHAGWSTVRCQEETGAWEAEARALNPRLAVS